MFQKTTLKNGLTLITVPLYHLDSCTTMVTVGAGKRYETPQTFGISHFLEHMFFKGSTKFPTNEIIQTLLDGVGAVNNASTGTQITDYWIKSSKDKIELCLDILSSMLSEPLHLEEDVEKEKGVIAQELKMYRDNPPRYNGELFWKMFFSTHPMGNNVDDEEKNLFKISREDIFKYMDSLYAPSNMVLILAGNLPKNIKKLVEKYFAKLPPRASFKSKTFKKTKQEKPKVGLFSKEVGEANLILGMPGYDRYNKKKYAVTLLSIILGGGMSSRLFLEIRGKRGLAYHIGASHDSFLDTGLFSVSGGFRPDKIYEGLEVILAELKRLCDEKVTPDELQKAKEMVKGRLALSKESSNFLADYFGGQFILDKKIETFEEGLAKINAVTINDLQKIAQELFQTDQFTLQVIGPFSSKNKFEGILSQ